MFIGQQYDFLLCFVAFCKMSRFTRKSAPRLPEIEGEGGVQPLWAMPVFKPCFFKEMASLTSLTRPGQLCRTCSCIMSLAWSPSFRLDMWKISMIFCLQILDSMYLVDVSSLSETLAVPGPAPHRSGKKQFCRSSRAFSSSLPTATQMEKL